jgi:phosphoribosylformimino-5-aminoimidazole carboxamide ribotide isomerase
MSLSSKQKTEIIPAIDLLDGKVVRLYKGRYDEMTVYSAAPGDMVRRFIEEGARRIHVVDLNAARSGDIAVNRDARNEILLAAEGRADLEIGGGVRDAQTAGEYLLSGFRYIILGTAAVKDPVFLSKMIDTYGPSRILVGVDAESGMVRVSGWEENSGLKLDDYLQRLIRHHVQEIIFTDISTDGTLAGPAIDTMRDIMERYPFRLVASGGVSSIDDIRALLSINTSGRLAGIITGKAIYENKLDLREAIALTQA